jgi:hypothetical protein
MQRTLSRASVTLALLAGICSSVALGNMLNEAFDRPSPTTVHLMELSKRTQPEPSPTETPREGDPGFDCRIHGNKVCGPPPTEV